MLELAKTGGLVAVTVVSAVLAYDFLDRRRGNQLDHVRLLPDIGDLFDFHGSGHVVPLGPALNGKAKRLRQASSFLNTVPALRAGFP